MSYNFSNLKQKIKDVEEHLKNEYLGIRTGRASPALLDSIRVESYGSKLPVNQVAAISIEDARTLRISPWDNTQIKEIEKAITNSNLGVSISVDDKGIRIFFPELTSERREVLIKLVKEKLEGARISLRGERDHTWTDIQNQEKEGGMGEDEKFRYKDEMQKIVDDANNALEAVAERKEKEILS